MEPGVFAYNHGMSQITLVLPSALPVPEFAPDLVRALQAPALASLLSRARAQRRVAADESVRALPHETWLARALGLEPGSAGQPAFAGAALAAYGLEAGGGTWFIVNPVHIEIARTHLMMGDPRSLGLSDPESRALFDAAQPYVEEAGHVLRYGDAQTWFLRADDWAGLDTATPDAALGMDLTDWMPLGERAAAFRRLQNEIQILWHTHPVNAAREARRQPPVNAFWPWSPSAARKAPPPDIKLAAFDTPAWLTRLARLHDTAPSDLAGFVPSIDGDTLLVCGSAAPYAAAADWGGWVAAMGQLEAQLFAPILERLKNGRIRTVTLVMSHRDALLESTTNAMAQRKFWRRTTLESLL